MAEQETNPVETAPMDAQTARKVEQDKLSRRQALRKFGFGAGMAALALLGVDDLARMVGKRMERMAGDHQIAEQIAHEFREAGVAFADGGASGGGGCCNCFAQLSRDIYFCSHCTSDACAPPCFNEANYLFCQCIMSNCGATNCKSKDNYGCTFPNIPYGTSCNSFHHSGRLGIYQGGPCVAT